MAAGRWVGRGDKNGGDGAAVDAMRTLIGTVSMRGVVVIGEGEKDEAPMLLQRRGGRRRRGPGVRRRRRPGGRHHADGQGHAQRDRRAGRRRARHHVRPVGRLLHGQARHRPGGRRRRRHHRAAGGEHRPGGQGQGRRARGRHRLHPGPAAARGPGRARCGRPGARIKFITDGDVAGAIMAAREGTGVDLLLGIGGTPEGDHRGLRADLHGRRAAGQALAPRRRRAAEGARRRARPGPGAHHPTTWSAPTTSTSPRPG